MSRAPPADGLHSVGGARDERAVVVGVGVVVRRRRKTTAGRERDGGGGGGACVEGGRLGARKRQRKPIERLALPATQHIIPSLSTPAARAPPH